ncbi:MAG: hypothetical protein OHK0057_13660 [Thermoflexibacter sp.]
MSVSKLLKLDLKQVSKIKVNIEQPDPDTQTIQKYKNFNRFITTYHQLHTPEGIRKMWYRDRKTLAFIIVVICLLLIWILGGID